MMIHNTTNHPHIQTQPPTKTETKRDSVDYLFTKYVVHKPEELKELNGKGLLKGAFIITGDKKHVGIHKIFWIAQIIRKIFESIRGLFSKKRVIDPNLCHGMIVVGWDNSWSEKRKAQNDRPLLAHAVMDGVKINAVDYFNYADKDVDHMVVYVPKDPKLREEYVRHAQQSSKHSSNKADKSKFSWYKLIFTIFRTQIYSTPTQMMQKELAYTVADLLLHRKISDITYSETPRNFYCIEYAVQIMQASILTSALTIEDKKALLNENGEPLDRKMVAMQIYKRLKEGKNNEADPLAKAYWSNRICREIRPNGILSGFAAYELDKVSEKVV